MNSPPVPQEVQDLLSRMVLLAREAEPYVVAVQEEGIHIDYRQGGWTQEMVTRFRREINPYQAAEELLTFAAKNAGREVSYREFLEQSSRTNIEVRSELGAISKVARRLFGKKVWPVRTRQASDGGTRYLMPPGIARWWIEEGSPGRERR